MRVGPPRTAQQRADALACLLGIAPGSSADRVQEALSLADAGTIDLSGLIAVWRGAEAAAATLWCLNADGSAFVWPPEVRPGGHPADAVASLEDVISRCRAAGCPFAQSAVDPERREHHDALRSAGFYLLTDLLSLKRHLREPLPAVPPLEGRLVAFAENSRERFAALVERTYVASEDCPGFAGVRSAADALRSYESAGRFTPKRWRLVERSGEDVAVILVNEHDEQTREIVYVGVTPGTRRQGLGKSLIGEELNDAVKDGFLTLVTSVDANNQSAVTLYSRLGFFPGSRHSIYLNRLSR